MNVFKRFTPALVVLALVGCAVPGDTQNKIAESQSDAALDTILANQLKEGINQSVYSEDQNFVILGDPFKFKEEVVLPEIFSSPTRFKNFRAKPLGEVVDYLNNTFSPYGVYISFSADAIAYLSKATEGDTSKSTETTGTSDSTGEEIDVEAQYTNSNTAGLIDGAGVTISLRNESHIAFKQLLDSIAAKTNLWWKYGDDGRVTFYRQDTQYFRIDQYAESTTLKSSINSSTGGGEQGSGTSSATASSHSYTLDRDLGKPLEQLLAGVQSVASEEARVEVLPALSLVAVTDTPAKLALIEAFIHQSNSIAGKMIRLNIELWEVITTDSTNMGIEQAIKYQSGSTELKFDGVPIGDSTNLGGFGIKISDGAFKGTEMAIKALQGTKALSLKKTIDTTVPNNDIVPIQYVNERKYADKIETSVSGDVITTTATTDTTTNGIVFFATPKVNSNGTIAIRLVTDISSLNALDPLEVGDTQLQLTDRTVSALVSARNVRPGETIIMTGFEQVIDNSQNQSMLGDMFWWLGGNDSSKKQRSVMLILVTPHIEKV
ncbi:hypothetical protein [Vibrio splendidus]|uniref:hypothetical protein n=1 Tax=Vibrio splendidus TaxID=29497 RepID=UPI003D12DA75